MKYITVDDPNFIWTPDLFFVNEKEGHTHDISEQNRFIKIYPDGNVSYSQRYLYIKYHLKQNAFH